MPEILEKLNTYSYNLPHSTNWKFCPNCRKRLFEVIQSDGFTIEIKCRCCKKIVSIEQEQVR
ncbi:hypothetical protein CLV62_12058 [Dysgonomonas alginatilytica]|uniref:Mu-like prophage protein Com n=1 Tax=Dysgonomonas alginatilytica TaxID=1605892 RepID=A0A2V3PL68_9BACT|nr:hypothetical protein [Dysgonomonas alginatilytica]PXV62370.1 hypothetical protein CLV62_12058 [Dysgonomonas alginatilytica]